MMYRAAVWSGYVQWILGELDILPRLHAAWLTWAHPTKDVHIVTIAERIDVAVDETGATAVEAEEEDADGDDSMMWSVLVVVAQSTNL